MGMKFLHLPKSREFKMVTRFYDPQKEHMMERQERINQELDWEQEKAISYGSNIKGKFRASGRHYNSKTLEGVRRQSYMRLIYLLIILCVLFYFFLK